ncbi:EAL and HDOD domain-containing protein [Clostridium vincentii]|uniref:HDOD domain protein n=1 Tax=Clostridium vincentii TaxID=52704 RepID=A0A2T0BEH4_9CLOT|nr:HDOD domain-containing protein [Clostridium vincentii]PRR82301.1 HDOD domain protein [Clostridium vincentii]
MDIFLARQAIYNTENEVVAYELLFRNSNSNSFAGDVNEEKATIKLISNCATIGLSNLTNGKRAFINFPKGVLLKDIICLLEREEIVVEILENVNPTYEILTYLMELKNRKYIIALDDVVIDYRYKEFGALIDIYKIDFVATTKSERVIILNEIRKINPQGQLLAEKVETKEDYKEALKNNYLYFQGYYFSKPTMISAKDIAVRNVSCFNIMVELLSPDFDVDKIEKTIKSDVAISYKLIKFLNSASFSFVQKIRSIKQSIALLGKKDLAKWLSLVVISEMQNSNAEYTNNTIIRARFCELIAKEAKSSKESLVFMVGLFSNLDVFMNRSMKDIIVEIPLEEEAKDALLGCENDLSGILNLVKAYEKMDMKKVEEYSDKLNIDKKGLINIYIESIEWLNCLTKNF